MYNVEWIKENFSMRLISFVIECSLVKQGWELRRKEARPGQASSFGRAPSSGLLCDDH